MIRPLFRNIGTFVLLVLLQVLVFNNIQFSGLVNPYFYVIFILLLPFETPGWLLLLSSFFLGFLVDIFSHTPGMHAMASTAMAAIRPSVLKGFSPRDGYEPGTLPRIKHFGLVWFLKYALILVFAHHFVLFFAEMFRFSDFGYTLLRVFFSTLFSVLLIIVSQYFIFRR